MSIAKHHAEWLSLIEVSGPFLSLPVLLQRFPEGMDANDPEHAKALRRRMRSGTRTSTATDLTRRFAPRRLELLPSERWRQSGGGLPTRKPECSRWRGLTRCQEG